MKLMKITVKNFDAIYKIMETKHITIDFSSMDSRICILLGPNGSGKTYLLSLMTPFSGVGTLDIRSDLPLIRKGHKGYKLIEYKRMNDRVVIEHFYTPTKDTHSVKSYFKLNDVELNPNGNVSSFLAIVEEEFGLTMDLLKVIRLGNNVSSILRITPTKRKEFIATQLEDISKYLEIGANATAYAKKYNAILNYIIDRITKLNITSIPEQEELIKDSKHRYESKKLELNDNQSYYATLEYQRSKIPYSLSELDKEIKRQVKQQKKIMNTLETFHIDDIDKVDIKMVDTEKEHLQKITISIVTMEQELDHLSSQTDQLNGLIDKYKIELMKSSNKMDEFHKLEVMTEELRTHIDHNKSRYKHYKVVDQFAVYELIKWIKDTHQVLTSFLISNEPEFIQKGIQMVVTRTKEESLSYFEQKELEINIKRSSIGVKQLLQDIIDDIHCNPFPNCMEKESCIGYRISKKLLDIDIINGDDMDEITQYYQNLKSFTNILYQLFEYIDTQSIIEQLPKSLREILYDRSNILNRIKNGMDFLPFDTFEDYYALVRDYNNYQEDKKRFAQYDQSYKILKDEVERIGRVNESISDVKTEYDSVVSKLSITRHKYDEMLDEKQSVLLKIQSLEECIEYKDSFHELDDIIKKLEEDYRTLTDIIHNMQVQKKTVSIVEQEVEQLRKIYEKEMDKLEQYHSLLKEQQDIEVTYNQLNLIKRSASVKEGVPLKKTIQYMWKIRKFANDILSFAFDGSRQIGEFVINDKDFFIEYYVGDNKIRDVKYASQGEEAFLTIAVSLAIMMEAIERHSLSYNILLLDEMDGPLDTSNRQIFIKIIMNILKKLNVEQCFIITHNDMFQYEPCNIIRLNNGVDISSYTHAKEIKIKK